MPNNGWKPSRCRRCQRKATDRRPVSYRGLCGPCAELAVTRAATEVSTKRGPLYDRWREGMARAVANADAQSAQ